MVQREHFVRQKPMERVAALHFQKFFAGAFEDFLAQRQGVKLHAPDHARELF
jgi:hypothetical protein